MRKMNVHIRNLVYSALCLSLCLVLPFLTGQLQSLGSFLSPMHLPVLLCGLICTWYWGALVGFIAPLLRFVMFGMPMIVKAVPMAFELAAYGAVAGLLMMWLPKKLPYLCNIYASLVGAMIAGRIMWALATLVCFFVGFTKSMLTFKAFLATEFVGTWAGIVLQLVIIPPVVLAMHRAHLISNNNKAKKE